MKFPSYDEKTEGIIVDVRGNRTHGREALGIVVEKGRNCFGKIGSFEIVSKELSWYLQDSDEEVKGEQPAKHTLTLYSSK